MDAAEYQALVLAYSRAQNVTYVTCKSLLLQENL